MLGANVQAAACICGKPESESHTHLQVALHEERLPSPPAVGWSSEYVKHCHLPAAAPQAIWPDDDALEGETEERTRVHVLHGGCAVTGRC